LQKRRKNVTTPERGDRLISGHHAAWHKQRTATSNIRFGRGVHAALHALKTIRTSRATVTIAGSG
jgi:hypothetical protein